MKRALLAAAVGVLSVVSLAAMADPTGTWAAGYNTKTCASAEWNPDVPHRLLLTNVDGTKLIVPGVGSVQQLYHVESTAEGLALAICANHKPYSVYIADPTRLPAPVARHLRADF